jgi:hypothetical protein
MATRGGPVVLWLVATATAIVVASAAIAQVGRQVALDTPIDEQLAQAAGTGPDAEGSSGLEPATPDPGDPGADVDGASITRTYDAVGGSAAIVIVDGTIDLRWATPNDGFRASVERSPTGKEVRVDFRSDSHRSRIKVEIEDGEIVDGIEEDDRR